MELLGTFELSHGKL